MTKKEAKKRIKKLRKVIRHHRYLYHVENRQEISPDALDSLKHELYKLEQKYPDLITPDSPTQRVAGKPLEGFEKVKHGVPMLSTEDVFSREELEDWRDYLKRLAPSASLNFFCELKIDGFAISLVYEDGIFVQGSTRGDGRVGEDVTQNLKTIESIPLKLHLHGKVPNEKIEKALKEKIKKSRIEVRGEVYMTMKDFEEVNQEREAKGEEPYANPRNLAAGSIRQLDPKLAASRNLSFLAYDLVTDLNQEKHSQEHQVLKALGFKVDKGKGCKNLDEVIEFWKEASKKRKSLSFQIDGVIVNIDDNSLFEKLGVAGKSPRGIRALKFSPKQATTKIKNIKVQVGRTGAITPIAVLEPVKVGGVTISRATLHNQDEMEKLGVKIGDTVIVQRAGDVIPEIVKVLKKLRTGKEKRFSFPKKCPVCGTKLVRPKGEAIWRCPNSDCRAIRKEFLYHFVSKKAFDIEGLGPKIIDQLIKEDLISEAPDLFELEEGDLVPLEGFAEKAAKNLISAIQDSKKIPLSSFLYALSIRYVGEETAIDLAHYFHTLKAIKKASKEELEEVPDIGPNVAKSIYDWFREKKNLNLIKSLKEHVKITSPEVTSKKLEGKTFVFTGSLEAMTRNEAKKKVRMLGGDPSSSVSKKTDFVVVGKNPGSKLEKAKELGIKTINEEKFLKMLE